MELIERIQDRLDYLGWSWADLARAMGMIEQRVNNWRTRGIPARELRNVEFALMLPRYSLEVTNVQQTAKVAVTAIRRARLKQWFANRTLPEKEKSYLSQLIGGKTSFGEKAARRLEKDYGMPDGHLDRPLNQPGVESELPGIHAQQKVATSVPFYAELAESWAYLLPHEQSELLADIKRRAEHNKAVLEHYSKS